MRDSSNLHSALVVWLCLGTVTTYAHSQDERPSPQSPIRLRSIHVPQSELRNKIPGRIPVKHDDYIRWADSARVNRPSDASAGVFIERAVYRGQLADTQVIHGAAELDISHAAPRPRELALTPLRFAISNVRWVDRAGKSAAIGISNRGSSSVIVDRSGKLAFNWTLRLGDSSREFEMILPKSPATRIELDVPGDFRVESNAGVPLPPQARAERWVWPIELGPHNNATIRLVSTYELDPRFDGFYRQSNAYRFSRHGLDFTSHVQLHRFNNETRRILLEVDPGMQVSSVRLDGEKVVWQTDETLNDGSIPLSVDVPASRMSDDLSLVVKALGKPPWRRLWTLPGVRPSRMIWQSGDATVETTDFVSVRNVRPGDSRQLESQLFVESSSTRVDRFAYLTERPAIQVQIEEAPSTVLVTSRTFVSMGRSTVSATVKADFSAVSGQRYQLQFPIKQPWSIDAVVVDEPDSSLDWELVERDSSQLLEIKLNRPLRPGRKLALTIEARRLAIAPDVSISSDEFDVCEFAECTRTAAWAAVHVDRPFRLEVDRATDLQHVDGSEVSSSFPEKMVSSDEVLAFMLDASPSGLAMRLAPADPAIQASITITVICEEDHIEEIYEIDCIPTNQLINRLRIQLSDGRVEPIRWSFVGESSAINSTALTRPVPQDDATPNNSELWELQLVQPRDTRFVIRGRRSTQRGEVTPIPLISVREAVEQSGRVTIELQDGVNAALRNTDKLVSILPMTDTPSVAHRRRIAFQYDPRTHANHAGELPLAVVQANSSSVAGQGYIQFGHCSSSFDDRGYGHHEVFVRLCNGGLNQLPVRVPSGVNIHEIHCDGERIRLKDGADLRTYAVPLDSSRPLTDILIRYTSAGPAMRWFQDLRVPRLYINLPVHRASWALTLPDGFAVREVSSATTRSSYPSWCRRLFPGLIHPSTDALPKDGTWSERPPVLQSVSVDIGLAGSMPQASVVNSIVTGPNANGDTLTGKTTIRVNARLFADAPVRLLIYRNDMAGYLGWVMFLVSLATFWWLDRRWQLSTLQLLVLALLSAAINQLVPEPGIAAMCGITWGVVLWTCIRGTLTIRETQECVGQPSRIAAKRKLGATATALMIVVVSAGVAMGEERPEPTQLDIATEFTDVVVPIDSEGKTLFDYVYVPNSIYDRIQRWHSQSAHTIDWIIQQARYETNLTKKGNAYEFADFQIHLHVDTFAPMVKVQIPLSRTSFHLLPDGVTDDGQSVAADWPIDSDMITIPLQEAGPHEVTIRALPVTQRRGARQGLWTRIPAVPNSTVTLFAPDRIADLLIDNSLGEVKYDSANRMVQAQLGPINELGISWHLGGELVAASAPIEVDQLSWIMIDAGALFYEVRVNFALGNRELSVFELECDLPLVPFDVDPDKQDISRVPTDGDRRVFAVTPTEPMTGNDVWKARFVLPIDLSQDEVRLPNMWIRGVKNATHFLGVTLAPGVFGRMIVDESLVTPNLTAELLQGWSEKSQIPRWTYSIPLGGAPLSFRPDFPTRMTSVTQDLLVGIGRNMTYLQLIADVSVTDGSRLHQSFSVPSNVEVLRVSATGTRPREQRNLVERWNRDREGHVHVLFSEALEGEYQLQLEGRTATTVGVEFSIPRIDSRDAVIDSTRIALYRERDVQVQFARKPVGVVQAPRPDRLRWSDTSRTKGLRPVTALDSIDTDWRVHVAAMPSIPHFRAELAIVLRERNGRVEHEVFCEAAAKTGEIDSIRVQSPSSWQLLTVEGDVSHRLIQGADRDHQILEFFSPKRSGDAIQLRFQGKWDAANRGTEIPRFEILESSEQAVFVALPEQLSGQDVVWETDNLQRVERAEPDRQVVPDGYQSYLAIGKTYGVRRVEETQKPQPPQAHLSDYRIELLPTGEVFGLASFYFEPQGANRCDCEFPSSSTEIAQVFVMGKPAIVSQARKNELEIYLQSSQLPQRIDVIFSSKRRVNGTGDVVVGTLVPTLRNTHVAREAWTISSSRPIRVKGNVGTSRDRMTLAVERARVTNQLIANGLNELTSNDPSENASWHRDWRQQVDARISDLTKHASTTELERTLQSTHEVRARLTEQLGPSNSNPSIQNGAALLVRSPRGEERSQHVAYYLVDSPEPRKRIDVSEAPQSQLASRLLAASVFGVIAITLWRVPRLGQLADKLIQRPWILVALSGLIIWQLLGISLLGLLILAMGLIMGALDFGLQALISIPR